MFCDGDGVQILEEPKGLKYEIMMVSHWNCYKLRFIQEIGYGTGSPPEERKHKQR